jgi:6-bladed beta-propeller
MRSVRPASVLLALVAAALSGCDADAADREPSNLPVAWVVEDSAVRRIGVSDADALVSVSSGVMMPDGRIAVADAGARRIELFGADGRRVRSIGREGNGPGEFAYPAWIGLRGDTLRAWDMVHGRLSLFDTAGRLIRTEPPITDLGSFPRVAGQFGDGALLAVGTVGRGWREGAFRDSLLLVRLDPASGRRDTLARVPGDEQYGTRSADGRTTESATLPFGRRTLVAARGDRLYVGTADSASIVATRDGRSWKVAAAVPGRPRAVTRQDVDEYWSRIITRGGSAGRASQPPSGLDYPDEHPSYADLAVSPAGDVWVALPSPPSEWAEGSRWIVFASDGSIRGTVDVPGRSRILDIGEHEILVSELDSDERQLIARRRLLPPR